MDKKILRNIIFLLGKTVKLNPVFIVLTLLQVIAKSIQPVLLLLFIKTAINLLATNELSISNEDSRTLLISMGFYLVVVCLQKLTLDWTQRETVVTALRLKADLARVVGNLPYQDYEDSRVKNLIVLASDQGPFFRVIDHLSIITNQVLVIFSLTFLVLEQSVLIVLIMISTVLFRIFIDNKNRKVWHFWREKYSPITRRINYFFELMYSPQYGKEIRSSQAEEIVEEGVHSTCEDYISVSKRHNGMLVKNNSMADFAVILQELIIILVLGLKVIGKEIAIGNFVMVFNAAQQYSSNLLGVVSEFSELILDASFIEEYRWFMTEFDGTKQQKSALNSMVCCDPVTIEFRNVSFKYPGSEDEILHDISVKIHAGESLSIVGGNGAGKSTFIKLLCGLYEPTSGEILVNGQPLEGFSGEQKAQLFAPIFQDYKMLAFSVRETIFGNQVEDDARLDQALLYAGMMERLTQISSGKSTYITKEFSEEGVEFSGGEMQKIALARMIYKNSPVMILDEPTAAMDPMAEYELYRNFGDMVVGKTSIYISHRLSSTRFTDTILVLDKGQIVERGNHDELISNTKGLYYSMFSTQAAWYKNNPSRYAV